MNDAESRPLRILHVSEVTWGGVVTVVGHLTADRCAPGTRSTCSPRLATPPSAPASSDTRGPWCAAGRRPTPVRSVSCGAWWRSRPRRHPPALLLRRTPRPAAGWCVRYRRRPGGLPPARVVGPAVHQSGPAGWCAPSSGAAPPPTLLVGNVQDELDRGRSSGSTSPATRSASRSTSTTSAPDSRRAAAARATLGFGAGETVALVLGRLSRQKGQDQLLTAWDRLDPGRGPGTRRAGSTRAAPGPHPGSVGQLGPCVRRDRRRPNLAVGGRRDGPGVTLRGWATGRRRGDGHRPPDGVHGGRGRRRVVARGTEPPAGAVVPLEDMSTLVTALATQVADPKLRRKEAEADRDARRPRYAPTASPAGPRSPTATPSPARRHP